MSEGCIKRGVHPTLVVVEHDNKSNPSTAAKPGTNQQTARLNINTASAEELEKLPGIGKGFSERIIEHREKFGPFRKPEHLIMVRGISDKRFRALRDMITVE
jgi:competence protein ComEA